LLPITPRKFKDKHLVTNESNSSQNGKKFSRKGAKTQRKASPAFGLNPDY
jgi:hypothetical protein